MNWSFEPLYNLTDVLMWMVGNKDVNMLACYFARQNLKIMLHSNLPYQYLLAILWYPYQVDLQIIFRVRTSSVLSHATILHEFSIRLKASGFHHPRSKY